MARKKAATKRKRGRGRPRKLAKKKPRDVLLRLIRRGVSFANAVRAVDCCYHTLLAEIDRDPEFAAQIERAKAQRIATLTRLVFEHAKTDAKTAVHLLACLDPAYSRNGDPQIHLHAHKHEVVAVEEDSQWYGNNAHDKAAQAITAPATDVTEPLKIQGDCLREAVGKNGNGSAHGH